MVIVGILLVVALWWHCDDTVVSVEVTMFIVAALWEAVVILCSLRLHCSSTVVTVVILWALWWSPW